MEISIEVTKQGDAGIDKMLANFRALDGMKIEAGIFGGFDQKKAMWNEYGTSRGIPSRPFLRNTLYENEGRFTTYVTPFIQGILDGGSADTVASALGPFMAMSIRRTIASGGFAPNAPSTIARKGHSKPLIESGSMYGSIDWRRA